MECCNAFVCMGVERDDFPYEGVSLGHVQDFLDCCWCSENNLWLRQVDCMMDFL